MHGCQTLCKLHDQTPSRLRQYEVSYVLVDVLAHRVVLDRNRGKPGAPATATGNGYEVKLEALLVKGETRVRMRSWPPGEHLRFAAHRHMADRYTWDLRHHQVWLGPAEWESDQWEVLDQHLGRK